jgi:hypothetical protein
MKKAVVLSSTLTLCYFVAACGVRGDPVPPKTPTPLGRGEPTYKGATQNLAFPNVPPVYAPKTKDKKEENESR